MSDAIFAYNTKVSQKNCIVTLCFVFFLYSFFITILLMQHLYTERNFKMLKYNVNDKQMSTVRKEKNKHK